MSVFSYSNKKTARYFLAIRPSYYVAHNPEVVRFKSHSRNQRSPTKTSVWLGFFLVLPPCDLMFFRAFLFVFLRFCFWHFGRQICVTGSALLSWRPSPCVAKYPRKIITFTKYSIIFTVVKSYETSISEIWMETRSAVLINIYIN